MEINVKVTRTKTNLPAVAEIGGAIGKTKGDAQIFCRDDGGKKTATHIPRLEDFYTIGHALFVLQKHDYLIRVERSRSTVCKIIVAQFTGTIDAEENAQFIVRHIKSSKRWDVVPPDCLQPAIDAAVAKAGQTDIQEAVWYERKQPLVSLPVARGSMTARALTFDYAPGFVAVTDVKQTAADEISICLSNGIQLCMYIKACDASNYKAASTGTGER